MHWLVLNSANVIGSKFVSFCRWKCIFMSAYAQLEIRYVIYFTEQYFTKLSLDILRLQIDAALKLNAGTYWILAFIFWHWSITAPCTTYQTVFIQGIRSIIILILCVWSKCGQCGQPRYFFSLISHQKICFRVMGMRYLTSSMQITQLQHKEFERHGSFSSWVPPLLVEHYGTLFKKQKTKTCMVMNGKSQIIFWYLWS